MGYRRWRILQVSAVLTHGHAGQFVAREPHKYRGPMLIYVCCVQHVFLKLKHRFCWKYQYNKYMFSFIDIYSFIPEW